MVDVIIDQVAIKTGFDYWTLDLEENDLVYNPADLRRRYIGKYTMHAGYKFKIEDVEFYSIVKTKFVLKTVKQEDVH